MDQAMDCRKDIKNQGSLLKELLPAMEEQCKKLAEDWKDFPCYDFIGAGFDYATAWFGQAKMLEFGVADETAWRVGLSCGGKIRVFVERLS